jgi:hypothetical protein
MKILKLLEGIYHELKTYNEQAAKAEAEEAKKEEEKAKAKSEREALFDRWLYLQLKEKNSGISYAEVTAACQGYVEYREKIAKALGYKEMGEVTDAYNLFLKERAAA